MGHGLLSWASVMFAWNARPPHPDNFDGNGDKWREEWRKRLEEASGSWDEKWLSHQVRNDGWTLRRREKKRAAPTRHFKYYY